MTLSPNINRQSQWSITKSTTVQNPDSIEAMTPDTDRMVYGKFKNLENPGQAGYVGCRLYKGMQMFSRWFQDGEEDHVPLSVAKFINEHTSYPVHGYLLDDKGNYIKGTGSIVQRYEFVSVDFK